MDPLQLAETFSDFFEKKVQKIQMALSPTRMSMDDDPR